MRILSDEKRITRRGFLKATGRMLFEMAVPCAFLYFSKPYMASATIRTSKKSDDWKHVFEPGYLKLHRMGDLRKRAEKLWVIMESCQLCPRRCGVNRLKGLSVFCRAPGAQLMISSFHPHFSEERPLVGDGGSGTIFLTHCNLRCVFFQNWEISHLGKGSPCTIEQFARMMLSLKQEGCHNINLVTPTHYSLHLLKALDIAAKEGYVYPLYTIPAVGNVSKY